MKHLTRLFTVSLALLALRGALAQDNVVTAFSRSAPPPPGSLERQAEMEERYRKAGPIRLEAEKAIRKGEFARAVPLLRQVQELVMGDPRCMEYLADIYIAWKRPAEAIRELRPIYHPPANMSYGESGNERLRMKYILALLDTGQWEEASAIYDAMPQHESGKLRWQIPFDFVFPNLKEHTLPDAHFRPDSPDVLGLRTQAHLILGSRSPHSVGADTDDHKNLEYMLDHLQQALKSDRRCLDAQFLSGVLLGKLERFPEARAAFAKAALLAPREAQPEIKAALNDLKRYEESKKLYESQHPAETAQTRTNK